MTPLSMTVLVLALTALLFSSLSSAAMQPKADPRAIVLAGNARFTVLTPHVIRLEYSATHQWQDAATFVINYRHQPVPPFKTTSNATHTLITTSALTLEYLTAAPHSFNPHSIRISLTSLIQGRTASWNASNHQELLNGRLPGTFTSLDQTSGVKDVQLDCQYNMDGGRECTYGVISRGGYAVIDDTRAPTFDADPVWPWVNTTTHFAAPTATQCAVDDSVKRDCASTPTLSEESCIARGCCWHSSSSTSTSAQPGVPTCYYAADATQDLYFMGHGHDYKTAMREFTALAGSVPLPPRWAFGLWFSRWRAYGAYEEKELIRQFAQHDVPLDNLVSDMDWHLTYYKEANNGVHDQAGESIGWTGYTWNDELFDSPAVYMAFLRQFGIHSSLNFHPASGVQPWEETYSQVADFMGERNRTHYIPFNLTDKRYNTALFNITMRRLYELGLSASWLDWDATESFTHIPRATATWWWGYEYWTDPFHWTDALRPIMLHRWGGLGQHRYPIGFSGDVITSWDSLTLQPYFTGAASNVAFAFWSHDLGSFVSQPDAELYLRWLQWGAHSPIWRAHCTKYKELTKIPWEYDFHWYPQLRRMFKLRQALIPYVYTAARRTHETSLGMVLPLYYEWPELDEAYTYDHSYLFGTAFFVNPITAPMRADTQMTEWETWMPPGVWVNTFTGAVVKGPAVMKSNWTMAEMPAYAQAGAIVPMLIDSTVPLGQAEVTPRTLKLMAYVGGAMSGCGQVYDDSGEGTAYQQPHAFAYTNFTYTVSGSTRSRVELVIGPASGTFEGQPMARSYEVWLTGVLPATAVRVGGRQLNYSQYLGLSRGFAAEALSGDGYSYDGTTLSVVVNVRTPVSVKTGVTVVVDLLGAVDAAVLTGANGLQGALQRFITSKVELDSEWGTDGMVYMDDYPQLLRVAQMGERLSNAPHNATALLGEWPGLVRGACEEVARMTKLRPALKAQFGAQLCADQTPALVEGRQRREARAE